MNSPQSVVTALVAKFSTAEPKLRSDSYTETEARVEFIDPLFEALGWDMSNRKGAANSLKEVLREESQLIESSAKRPDYTFRIGGERKFFVEAKKPSVDITRSRDSAFQVRRYGWSAGLSVSVLTNFRIIRVYDTRTSPGITDDPDVALVFEMKYQDYPDKLTLLMDFLGRDAVVNNSIDDTLGVAPISAIAVNEVFLTRINRWRLLLAADLHARYPALELLAHVTQ